MVFSRPPTGPSSCTARRGYGICTLVFLFCCELLGMGRIPGGSGAAGPTGRRGLLPGALIAVVTAGDR